MEVRIGGLHTCLAGETCLTRFTIFSLCVMAATRAAARAVGLNEVSHTLLFFSGALLQSDGGHALAARTDAAEPRTRRTAFIVTVSARASAADTVQFWPRAFWENLYTHCAVCYGDVKTPISCRIGAVGGRIWGRSCIDWPCMGTGAAIGCVATRGTASGKQQEFTPVRLVLRIQDLRLRQSQAGKGVDTAEPSVGYSPRTAIGRQALPSMRSTY